MRCSRFSVVLAITAVSLLALAGSARAVTYTWIQGGDPTNWEDTSNWQGGVVAPKSEAGADLVFSASTSGQIGKDPNTAKVTFGSMSWGTSFTLQDFGSYTTPDGLVVDTGTSANATATSSNNAHLNAYYATWRLNSNLVVSGDGRLTVRAYNANGVRGDGGFIVEPGAELYFVRTHGTDNYVYTGGVTIQDGGVVDLNGRSMSMGALGDGLLTIIEGGRLQACNGDPFDQDVLFDINSTGTTNPFITSGSGASWDTSGLWTFDLADAGNTLGDSWTILNVTAGDQTWDAAFSVDGFTESGGVWSGIANLAEYQFDQSTGILSVVDVINPIPEPSTFLLAGLALVALALVGRRRLRKA